MSRRTFRPAVPTWTGYLTRTSEGTERPADTHGVAGATTRRSDDGCSNPFLMRLQQLRTVSQTELAALNGLFTTTRLIDAHTDLLVEGERGTRLHVLLEGWACCYRMLADGNRQVTTVLLPGDVCDLNRLYLGSLNYAVSTLSSCTVAPTDCSALRSLAARHPGIAASLGWLGAVENAALVERAAALGRRSARNRFAHLICELFMRLAVTGNTRNNGYVLPMTQKDLSDVLGLSTVHINRVLQRLRGDGLVTLKKHELVIRDWPGLCKEADFKPDYLYLGRMENPGSPQSPGSTAGTTAPTPARLAAAA